MLGFKTHLKRIPTNALPIIVAAALVLSLQVLAPLLPKPDWLPAEEGVNSFLRTLWQVHAALLALSIIAVTIIVTVIANQSERGRVWRLYSERSKIVYVVWFNLILVASEGLAVLQSHPARQALLPFPNVQNLIFVEAILFALSILLTGWLFTETLRFIDEDYVEDLAESRIISGIQEATQADLKQRQQKREAPPTGGAK